MTRAHPIPFLDLEALHEPLEEELLDAARKVIRSGRFILGPEVEAFEAWLAGRIGVGWAVGVSSGTDALVAALMALGVGAGSKVVTTAYSFVATAEAIARVGAEPVFADIEEDGFNMDPQDVAAVLDSDVAAVVPVHLFGRMADMEALERIVGDVPIVEDAAQSLGASIGGRPAGAWGLCGCFSFFPTKNLGALGDGGAVVTGDEALAARLRAIRVHGGRSKGRHDILGGNFRLDELQAAFLNVKAPHLDQWSEARRRNAEWYNRAFSSLELPIRFPRPDRPGEVSVWNQYVILAEDRDRLRAYLAEHGIPTLVYYETPLHKEPCMSKYPGARRPLARSEQAANKALALPVGPTLGDRDLERIVGVVADFYGKKS